MATTFEPLLSAELIAQLERMELTSRKIFRGRMKGERRSTRKGESVEFADFRNYAPGDDLRFVNWNSYARLDRLFLKLFLEEEDLRFYALIDASPSMAFGTPSELRYATQLAAALGFVGLARSDRVRIETLGQPADRAAPSFRGRKSLYRMLSRLESIQASETTGLAEGVKNFCIRNPARGIVLVISDLLDKQGYEPGLKFLLSRQMEVYVVQVLAQEELDPDLKGDLRLVDCEDNDAAEITANGPLLKHYHKTLAAFIEGAREFCTRRGMHYLLANNQLPIGQLVSTYLRKHGMVR